MLTNLPLRYDIGNCLFEAAYEEVLKRYFLYKMRNLFLGEEKTYFRCVCTPYFHWSTVNLSYILEHRPFCKVSDDFL